MEPIRKCYNSRVPEWMNQKERSGMDQDRERYLDNEQLVKRELRDAERVYVNGILQNGLESGNNKPYFCYLWS